MPLRRFFLPSAHIPIPPSFPRFAFTGAAAGENGAQLIFVERAYLRARRRRLRCFRAPACHRQGPSGIAGPVFFSLSSVRRRFRLFFPSAPGDAVSLFCCALRNVRQGACPPPCGVLRRGLPAAVPVPCLFPLPEGLPGAALFLRSSVLCHASTRHRFRPVQLRPAFLLLSVPRGGPGA